MTMQQTSGRHLRSFCQGPEARKKFAWSGRPICRLLLMIGIPGRSCHEQQGLLPYDGDRPESLRR